MSAVAPYRYELLVELRNDVNPRRMLSHSEIPPDVGNRFHTTCLLFSRGLVLTIVYSNSMNLKRIVSSFMLTRRNLKLTLWFVSLDKPRVFLPLLLVRKPSIGVATLPVFVVKWAEVENE
jgi:hypothetical protein